MHEQTLEAGSSIPLFGARPVEPPPRVPTPPRLGVGEGRIQVYSRVAHSAWTVSSQPSSGQRCARLITHFAVVLSAAEVLGKVKRPKGEELAKLACLAVFFNDGQDLRKQPGGMRVRIE
jgi:hypothetical protein